MIWDCHLNKTLYQFTKETMVNNQKANNTNDRFDGFSFSNSLESSNYWKQHNHEEIEIVLSQNNALALVQYESSIGEQYSQRIKEGQSFLISPNQPHSLDLSQKAELTLFYLHPRFIESAIADSIDTNSLEIDSRFSLVNDTLIREVGVILNYLCSHGTATEKLYIESLANLLAVHLLKNYLNYDLEITHSNQRLPKRKLKLVLDYIEENLEQKIKLSDLADITGIGKFYFCHLFKNSMAISPYKYVLQQRVSRAKKLLKYSNSSICDISFECGFSNQNNFAKHFKELMGKSPLKYRKEIE